MSVHAAGYLVALWPLVRLAAVGVQAGGVLLSANAIGTVKSRSRPLALPARLITIGQASLVIASTVAGLAMRPVAASPPGRMVWTSCGGAGAG